jgi:sterol desaturase/sphingolipid hydroxylase (fatty acid hydroxylase superfamily)
MVQFVAQHPAVIVFGLFVAFALAEAALGLARSPNATREDAPLEASITLLFGAVIYPGALFVVDLLAHRFIPDAAGALAHWPAWAMVVGLLLGDDLTQYWWHRASHSPLLWPLHRAHHSAPHMGMRVVYRNNFFYYAMMPGLWIGALLVYLGFGAVFPAYVAVKVLVIFGAHSELRWDRFLYRHRWLHPLAWIVERTISTPATHFAHHAIRQDDGIGHYKGNYGNLLFLWVVFLGWGGITRRYPPAVGLVDDLEHGPERWYVQLAWPVLKSTRERSALGRERTIVG